VQSQNRKSKARMEPEAVSIPRHLSIAELGSRILANEIECLRQFFGPSPSALSLSLLQTLDRDREQLLAMKQVSASPRSPILWLAFRWRQAFFCSRCRASGGASRLFHGRNFCIGPASRGG
jgi:hypothetical protein